MATAIPANSPQRIRDRRIVAAVVMALVFSTLGLFAYLFGSGYRAYWHYKPQAGDLLFQSLPHSPVVDAIEGATRSPYSHCGIVGFSDGRWVVVEALHGVEVTPLREFLFRGRDQAFAVYRLLPEHQQHIAETLRHAQRYIGRPYDLHYEMDDEKIYCSELIFKAYRDATDGQQLGQLVKFGELNWAPYQALIQQIEPGPIPVDREMITPRNLALASQLTLVYSHGFATLNSPP